MKNFALKVESEVVSTIKIPVLLCNIRFQNRAKFDYKCILMGSIILFHYIFLHSNSTRWMREEVGSIYDMQAVQG
jgi:hypothetical protein